MRMGSRGHQARAACAAPLPALLPTPEDLRQRHAHGGNGVYTILEFFFFLFIFYFCGDPKMGYNISSAWYVNIIIIGLREFIK